MVASSNSAATQIHDLQIANLQGMRLIEPYLVDMLRLFVKDMRCISSTPSQSLVYSKNPICSFYRDACETQNGDHCEERHLYGRCPYSKEVIYELETDENNIAENKEDSDVTSNNQADYTAMFRGE